MPTPRARITVGKAPCTSCPYRRDVPSGLWTAVEYEKLPPYDGTMAEQARDRLGAFYCHQNDGNLCAGWLGAHGPHNLLAVRLMAFGPGDRLDDAVVTYKSPVRLFRSGAQACAHGLRAIRRPGARARRMIAVLLRQRERRS